MTCLGSNSFNLDAGGESMMKLCHGAQCVMESGAHIESLSDGAVLIHYLKPGTDR